VLEKVKLEKLVTDKLLLSWYAREKTCINNASDLRNLGINMSETTIQGALKAAGFRKIKSTRKRILTDAMRQARLQFAKDHAY
jgi:hypothetical protein